MMSSPAISAKSSEKNGKNYGQLFTAGVRIGGF